MAKKKIDNYVFRPGIGYNSYLYPNAYASLNNNLNFIQAEVTAYLDYKIAQDTAVNLLPNAVALLTNNRLWLANEITAYIAYNVSQGTPGFTGRTYDAAKCTSDVSKVITAYINDLRYGGNENTITAISYYWVGSVPQIAGTRFLEIAGYTYLKSLIANYVFTRTVPPTVYQSGTGLTQNRSGSNAETAATTKMNVLTQNTIDVITSGLGSLPTTQLKTATFANYTYDSQLCIRDLNFVLNAYLHDIKYGGNEQTVYVVKFYWNGTVAQVNGSRQPEIQAHTYVYQLIANYIIKNLQTPTPYQGTVPQVIVPSLTYESAAGSQVTYLGSTLVSVIANGLSSVPSTIPATNGQLKIQGNYTLSDFLLITNTTTNTIIYNFTNPANGGVIVTNSSEFTDPMVNSGGNFPDNPITDSDFPQFRQTTDTVTFIEFILDTSSMSSTDSLQIFVEVPELTVRPYDFGTDAIERMRVATPQSMLDADFEYGLQPTKWQAIAVARGYPSIYEIPGTDQNLISIITDASTGTSGVGGSLITVTTASNHGFSTGQPITVRGLEPSVFGFSRAEGSYIITAVPTTKSFSYYAKAKVGTVASTSLLTTYTSVRQGGFYTGAEIGTPSFTVLSNGSTGTVTTVYATNSGSNKFAFTTSGTPSIGSPITGTGIPTGSQITSIVGSGGVIVTPILTSDYLAGVSEVDVASTANILIGEAVNNGAGTAIFVTAINNNTLSFSAPFQTNLIGNTVTYSSVVGTNIVGTGSSATFNVTRNSTVNYAVAVNAAGTGYVIGDTIKILGTAVGGTTPSNDIYITVSGISGGGVLTLTAAGIADPIANQTISADNTVYTTASTGTNAVFSVTRGVSAYTVNITNGGSGYSVNETFTILGTAFTFGATPTNDVTITVVDVSASYTGVSGTVSPAGGNGATFNVTRVNTVYTLVTLVNPGTNYSLGDTITILGTDLGGTTTTNDLTISVSGIGVTGNVASFTFTGTAGGTGAIATVSVSGTANSITTYSAVSGSNVASQGSLAAFNITRQTSLYSSVTLATNGIGYATGNRILILGTNLGGASPANDLVITVGSVNGVGVISTVSYDTGQAAAGGTTFALYSTITFSDVTSQSVPASTTINYSALATLRVDFANYHGFVPGSSIIVAVSSDNGVNNHNLAGGSYFITQVPTPTSIQFFARAAGNITGTIIGKVYARPDSFFTHRPFDGGVQLGTGGPQHGAQAIRQSKKYIRYQSGKGIMYTTGALFAPSYTLQSATASPNVEVGTIITFTTDDTDHGLQINGRIRISGVTTPGYNGDYDVYNIINERVFQVVSLYRLGSQTAQLGNDPVVSVLNWQGAAVRAGTFDDQNGIFWEYDGAYLWAVQRSATKQLAGTVTAVVNSNLITGTNTRFRDQLKAGDTLVIRGMTHVVSSVVDQFTMYVTPDYRGVNNISGAKICSVVEKRVPQYQWNIDRLDGRGPSGYKLDITKMQMIGLQWSWYGAGFIDWMLRGSNGNFIFCHRMRNSNVNYEAYMRTGNMPVRYEVQNYTKNAALAADMTATQNTIVLDDATPFPTFGTVYIDNELMYYSGKTNNTLTGVTRQAQLNNFTAGAARSYTAGPSTTHSARTGVVLVSNTVTPQISHWGSAMITDGRFDEDRGYLFSYTSSGTSISTTKVTAFLIRLAPSVSNAVVGDLGDRELINRAQLLLQEISISTEANASGGVVIEGILNPQNYPVNPGDITWGGLSGLSQGGQPSFAQIAPGGSVNWNGGATTTTATITVINPITTTVTVPTGTAFNRSSGTSFFYVTKTSWDSAGAFNGINISDGKFTTSGTKVSSVTASPSPQATTLPLTVGTATVAFSQSSGQSVQYFTQTSWQNLNAKVGYSVYTLDNAFPSGTTITQIQGPFNFSGINYYQVNFSQSSSRAINQGTTVSFQFGGTQNAGSTVLYFTQSSWAARPIDTTTGQTTNSIYFTNGTTINTIGGLDTFAGSGFYAITFSTGALTSVAGGATVVFTGTSYYTIGTNFVSTSAVTSGQTVTLAVSSPSGNTSVVYVTSASWEATGATIGTSVAATETKFPAGTAVSSVSTLQTFNGVTYYSVTFTQSSNTSINAAATVTLSFGNPAYAQPGEKVFSFIASPGTSDSLDLSSLKELTVTALGGRGTYPNGPDVLAINVYKTAGTAVTANIILRWSEAQA